MPAVGELAPAVYDPKTDPFMIILDQTREGHLQLDAGYRLSILDISDRDYPSELLQAFKLSFKYSAGSPVLQTMLQLRYIKMLGCIDGAMDNVEDIAPELPLDEDNFHIPAHHKYVDPRYVKRAQAMWSLFMDMCVNTEDISRVKPRDQIGQRFIDRVLTLYSETSLYLPPDIMGILAFREATYMDNGRPKKPSFGQTYRSDIREHGLEGQPTGNLEFDVMFREVGLFARIIDSHDADFFAPDYGLATDHSNLQELKHGWKKRHNSPFFPS